MKTKLMALATVATFAFGAPALAQDTFDMGFNMLTGSIYNNLVTRGIQTDGIQNLTLSQLATIKGILDSGETDSTKNERVLAILQGVN